jgi:hypothetical protein
MTDSIQKTGLGATPTSSKVPILLAGLAVLAGIGIAISMASKAHKETVEEEAETFFPGPRGQSGGRGHRALAYRASVSRCFYRELRRDHGYDVQQAVRLTERAAYRERTGLTSMSHTGKTVTTGCSLLRRHAPRIYTQP